MARAGDADNQSLPATLQVKWIIATLHQHLVKPGNGVQITGSNAEESQ